MLHHIKVLQYWFADQWIIYIQLSTVSLIFVATAQEDTTVDPAMHIVTYWQLFVIYCSGFCGFWQTSSCYKCGQQVHPTCIKPPEKRGPRITNHIHQCDTADCPCNSRAHSASRGGASSGIRGRGQSRSHNLSRGGSTSGSRVEPSVNPTVAIGNMQNLDPGSDEDYDVTAGMLMCAFFKTSEYFELLRNDKHGVLGL